MKSVIRKIKNWYPSPALDFGVNLVVSSPITPARLKGRTLRLLGVDAKNSDVIMHGVTFGGKDVVIGERTFINNNSFIDNAVTIGEEVGISSFVRIMTGYHEVGEPHHRMGKTKVKPTRIGDGALIYSSAIILPGCHVAEGCIIAAGAVVNKPTEPNGLYAGVPARRIRDLD